MKKGNSISTTCVIAMMTVLFSGCRDVSGRDSETSNEDAQTTDTYERKAASETADNSVRDTVPEETAGKQTEQEVNQETDQTPVQKHEERFYTEDTFVMNIDFALTANEECSVCDDWSGKLQAILDRDGETLNGVICAVAQNEKPESAGECVNVAGILFTDGLMIDAFSLPYSGTLQKIDFAELTFAEDDNETLVGACNSTNHLLFDDIMSTISMSGKMNASKDIIPPNGLIDVSSLHGLEPVAVHFTEPVSCDDIEFSVISGGHDFPVEIAMTCDSSVLNGLTREIELKPTELWRAGEVNLVISGLMDAEGNTTPSISFDLNSTVPVTEKNLGFELGDDLDEWIATSCFLVKEYQELDGDRRLIFPPEGKNMVHCPIGGQLLGRIEPAPEAAEVAISLRAETFLTFGKKDVVRLVLMTEKGRIPMVKDAATGRYSANIDLAGVENRDIWIEIVNDGFYTEGGRGTVVLADDIKVRETHLR